MTAMGSVRAQQVLVPPPPLAPPHRLQMALELLLPPPLRPKLRLPRQEQLQILEIAPQTLQPAEQIIHAQVSSDDYCKW